jgi:hypothetical protein
MHISLGTLDSKASFRAITFPQNIVNGGSPPRFLRTSIITQNDLVVFILFIFKFSSILRLVRSVKEYSDKNIKNTFIEHINATISHLLLFIDDNAIILFTEDKDLMFWVGVIRVTRETRATTFDVVLFSAIILKIVRGRIFCHVISTTTDLCFISINEIIFRYHKWKGHAPTFISTPAVISRVVGVDFS